MHHSAACCPRWTDPSAAPATAGSFLAAASFSSRSSTAGSLARCSSGMWRGPLPPASLRCCLPLLPAVPSWSAASRCWMLCNVPARIRWLQEHRFVFSRAQHNFTVGTPRSLHPAAYPTFPLKFDLIARALPHPHRPPTLQPRQCHTQPCTLPPPAHLVSISSSWPRTSP